MSDALACGVGRRCVAWCKCDHVSNCVVVCCVGVVVVQWCWWRWRWRWCLVGLCRRDGVCVVSRSRGWFWILVERFEKVQLSQRMSGLKKSKRYKSWNKGCMVWKKPKGYQMFNGLNKPQRYKSSRRWTRPMVTRCWKLWKSKGSKSWTVLTKV